MHLIKKIIKDVSAENVVQIVTDHKACIGSAKRICSWLYNSNSLHHMMKKAIGGELVKWNATRFDTNYMFLDREEKQNFTHATQDQDHGAPTSQRQTRSGRRARSTPKYAPHLQLPHRIGEGCHRHRYRNNLFILPFGYQVRMDCRCVSV